MQNHMDKMENEMQLGLYRAEKDGSVRYILLDMGSLLGNIRDYTKTTTAPLRPPLMVSR